MPKMPMTHVAERTAQTRQARLGERLAVARQRLFVGRERELALADALLGHGQSHHLLFTGPPGIGKTSLLRAIARRCRERGLAVLELDGLRNRLSPPSLAELLHPPAHEPQDPHGLVLVIDNLTAHGVFEALEADAGAHAAQGLPPVQVVGAARTAPEGAPGGQPCRNLHHVPLSGLRPEDVDRYLLRRGLDPEHLQGVKRLAAGNPLLLSLAGDSLLHHGPGLGETEAADGILPLLARRFLDEARAPEEVLALQASAIAYRLDTPLLQAMLPETDATRLIDWLASLSCTHARQTAAGRSEVQLHEALRNVVFADLRERHARLLETLIRRAEDHFSVRSGRLSGPASIDLARELTFLSRQSEMSAAHHEQLVASPVYTDRPSPAEARQAPQWTARLLGREAAACLERWLQRQPEGLRVVRGRPGQVEGYYFLAELSPARPAEFRHDPVARACVAHMARLGGAPGRHNGLCRLWLDCKHGLAPSATYSLMLVETVNHCLSQPDIGFFGALQPDDAAAGHMAEVARHDIVSGTRARLGGTPVMVTMHDWRNQSVIDWLIETNRRVRAMPA